MRAFRPLVRLARVASLVATSLFALLAVACGDEEKAEVRLNVVFPSPALAIATDEVKFVVFDDPAPRACERIYLKRTTKQTDLPPAILDAPPVAKCDLALGKSAPFELPVGKHSILAVGLRAKDDLLVGCSDVALSAEGGEVFVNLALPGETPVPSPLSSCLSVKDACEKRCQ